MTSLVRSLGAPLSAPAPALARAMENVTSVFGSFCAMTDGTGAHQALR